MKRNVNGDFSQTIDDSVYEWFFAQRPQLYPYLTQLQPKLIDVYLDSNISKQKSILDFFQT